MNIEFKEIQTGMLSGVRAGTGRIRVATVSTDTEIKELVKSSHKPLRPIGSGTNLLGSDNDCDGICIRLTPSDPKNLIIHGDLVVAAASSPLSALIKAMAENGLGGLSSLAGIPGTVGGALAGNAGANGHCIFDFTETVVGTSLEDGLEWTWKRSYGGWGYRKSPLKGLITAAIIRADFCNAARERQLINAEISRRRQFMPPYPTLGSTFKNPTGGVSAGKLLEDAGCKELSCGAFAIYEKHANWIVNKTRAIAPAADYLKLIEMMKQRVNDKFGIELEEEVRQIGEDR